MPISPNLEKYFKSQKSKGLKQKLDALLELISPEFFNSFMDFRSKLLWIVVEDSDYENMIIEELNKAESELKKTNSRYNLSLWASLIESTD